ncbi:protein phosphatase 2C domain-containing protein [Fischerella thermalis]|uniref:protein phosphatase 2C domain-containing protein n=1 Tax=Fischerella thermalis TaxID=372787 RepID=UPI000C803438|nr:protein phosphatase 2C domain-containing protein [Fischerella thermalis]PLZ16891.1 serine/threonine protein phosphatase [Fischerella thermalis WC341]PLZ66112.1 serine/threonine protein phosphatase [Fischerella thermalis WC246]PLZ75673.1 serine/threonine protein phosphatase [Fischerella thermalis WC245]
MISTQRIINCPNPICTHPTNPVGNRVCANCQTPLIHRYLWVIGSSAGTILQGEKVADRYEVIAPRIWLDTQPGKLPDIPGTIPKEIIPYLRLHQQRLHLPQVYGFVRSQTEAADDILLLENVPIDEAGNLYSALTKAWQQATAVRQVYWLWQILQLWQPLSELGVATSLLIPNNLRVQGWCVRLLQLQQSGQPSIKHLGECWQPLVVTAKSQVARDLQKIVQQMCSGEAELKDIAAQLNGLLLASAAELPLSIKVAGATDKGPEALIQNEDTCYPHNNNAIADSLLPRVAIVCDGIGGHEGGEVASQLAVQSVKLQIRALLQEVTEQAEIVPPDLLQQQLEASLRVINNIICNCNDEQKRTGTQRMATTIVMAAQIPQRIQTTAGWQSDNAHELYLINVGDSRAYWITRNYCQLLTVDDDVATREVCHARSLYRQALQRPDATALTQALGTKHGELLRPLVQRFILEEDGILLLCSDGLSDNNLVEQAWRDYSAPVFTGELTLEEAVHAWIKLANQKNGHDNVSVVLAHYRLSPDYLVPVTQKKLQIEVVEEKQVEIVPEEPQLEESEFAESSQVLLELDISPISETSNTTQRQRKPLVLLLGLLALLLGGATVGLFAWQQLQPQTLQQMCRRLPQRVQQLCLPRK